MSNTAASGKDTYKAAKYSVKKTGKFPEVRDVKPVEEVKSFKKEKEITK